MLEWFQTKRAPTTWLFVKPDSLTDIQFEEQLKNYDSEIEKWKSALESIST